MGKIATFKTEEKTCPSLLKVPFTTLNEYFDQLETLSKELNQINADYAKFILGRGFAYF